MLIIYYFQAQFWNTFFITPIYLQKEEESWIIFFIYGFNRCFYFPFFCKYHKNKCGNIKLLSRKIKRGLESNKIFKRHPLISQAKQENKIHVFSPAFLVLRPVYLLPVISTIYASSTRTTIWCYLQRCFLHVCLTKTPPSRAKDA